MGPGFNSVRVSFGDVFIRPQALPDGTYQQGTVVTLVVTIPQTVAWTGVDSGLGNEASVAMDSDRSVGVLVVGAAPTPAPVPVPVPTATFTPIPTAGPIPTATPTPVPGATATPTLTPTPTPEPTATPTPTPVPGGKIAFRSGRDGSGDIHVMNADGSNLTNLTILTNPNPANECCPSWSPDGTKIAFAGGRDGNWEIYVMNADGSVQTRLADNTATDDQPSWSP